MTPDHPTEERWFERTLDTLRHAGPLGEAMATAIAGGADEYTGGIRRTHRTRLGFARQSTGACWFDWRRLRFGIFLNADYAHLQPDDAWLAALLAHEARHLQQGVLEALSVRGELDAWQLQYDVLERLSAAPHDPAWRELCALVPDSRANLRRARALMKQIAGPRYRIGWLPLWPLPAEVEYQLRSAGQRVLHTVARALP